MKIGFIHTFNDKSLRLDINLKEDLEAGSLVSDVEQRTLAIILTEPGGNRFSPEIGFGNYLKKLYGKSGANLQNLLRQHLTKDGIYDSNVNVDLDVVKS